MNIENRDELQPYLVGKGFILPGAKTINTPLTGGVSGKTVLVEGGPQPMVIKQALSKLRTKADWYCNPERLQIEYEGLKWMHLHLPKGSVPEPLFYDEEHFLLGMEGIALPHQNFKTMLLNKDLQLPLVKKTGEMLGRIHHLGLSDEKALRGFADRTYFINLRVEPYYEYSKIQVPESKGFFEELIAETMEPGISLVHGDFSPKNILIKNGSLILLDFEVMHAGDPAFDVGFVLCHFLSKANYHDSEVFVDAAQWLWDNYRQQFTFSETNFEQRCVRHTVGCLIARVHGRSPLEYLNTTQQLWQSETALKLMHADLYLMKEFLDLYKKQLNERNH